MGQKKNKLASEAETTKSTPFVASDASVDPTLASLFDSSAGPVKAPQINYESYKISRHRAAELRSKDAGLEEGYEEEDEDMEDVSGQDDDDHATTKHTKSNDTTGRKRKRAAPEDDVEQSYMRRLEKEGAKEEEKRLAEKKEGKRRKVVEGEEEDSSSSDKADEDNSEDEDDDDIPPPVHEAMSGSTESADLDKSKRTVFLANVSTEAIKSKSAKKILLAHLSSFFPSIQEIGTPHAVESLRFRSTAFSSTAVPKRASFAKKELMDKTTRSTNAYVVYSTVAAARRAPTVLNGTVVLDRHLRVDSVAHPLPVDNKRCIFVGNLGFVDEETHENDNDESTKKKQKKPPSDIEEGLWRIFNSHTSPDPSTTTNPTPPSAKSQIVESVRVIRDPKTRIGKGFAYVQFHNENHVESALQINEKKFPPLLPRKLRITRARRMGKKKTTRDGPPISKARDEQSGSLQGRATRLFGRAGAAKLRSGTTNSGGIATGANSTLTGAKGEEQAKALMVFEGYRATADTPKFQVKAKSRGAAGSKGKGKPKTRSSRRGAAYKAQGGRR